MSRILEYHQAEFDRENGVSSITETLGCSEVTQIFAHAITSIEGKAYQAAKAPGIHRYAQRALLVARTNDIVCVSDNVDKNYLQFLSSLDIGPKRGNIITASENPCRDTDPSLPDSLVSNHDVLQKICGLVKRDDEILLNPFFASPSEFKLATRLEKLLGRKVGVLGGNSEIVHYANHKHNIRAKAIMLDVPVAEGEIVELQPREDGIPLDIAPLKKALDKYLRQTGKAIIRGSYAASGSATIIAENNSDSIQRALRKVEEQTDNRFYLVEVMLDVITSPNVLMHVEPNNGDIFCVSLTDQRLDNNLVHDGNVYPPSAKTLQGMTASARKLAKWLQGEGYTGLVGFDFGEYFNPETGQSEYFLAEINARTNGAAYPKSLMENLNRKQGREGRPYIEAFLSAYIKTKSRSFAEFRELYGQLFFKPETGKGLVPYCTGHLEYGTLMLAFLGKSRGEVVEMYEDFKALIKI